MIKRTARLRWRRRFKRHKRQVEDISQQADQHLERHFFKRLERLFVVRRFLFSWVILIVLLCTGLIYQTLSLSKYYQSLQPVPGGVYTEGVLGTFTNANPLYATSSVDSSVAKLVFASLLTYDNNNKLVGDLALDWTSDERGTSYTVHLKPNLVWQDGKPLTADDVIFTYQTIQNPDAQSPFINSWRDVTISSPDPRTIIFTLPSALSAFPYSLTNGIVPKHRLAGIPMTQMRSVNFNTNNPVGSGPFKWEAIEVKGDTPEEREERVGLVANELYYRGKPKLSKFIIRAIHDQNNLTKALENQELNGASGLITQSQEIKNNGAIGTYNIPLTGEAMVFFKTSQEILQDVIVRRALIQAIDTNQIITGLGYPVIAARGPLLKKQVGYAPDLVQLTYNPDVARQMLDEAGWQVDASGMRSKNGKLLSFKLFAGSSEEYSFITQNLRSQWKQIGANVEVMLQSDTDIQEVVSTHSYDALLYGISIGVDPDVFAYWHSSQADIRSPNRLNLSEYKSTVADKSLEAGRTRSDPGVRAIKYRPFLEAWRSDVPAIALYQPRFLYQTYGKLFGFEPTSMNSGPDRFNNVHNWMIRQRNI